MPNRDERRKEKAVARSNPDFHVLKWMNHPSPCTGSLKKLEVMVTPANDGWTNLDVMALLIAKNGFLANPTGWGRFQGPFGLTFPEYKMLVEMGAYVQGLMDASGLDSVKTLGKYLEPKLMALAAEFETVQVVAQAEAGPEASDATAAGAAPAEVAQAEA